MMEGKYVKLHVNLLLNRKCLSNRRLLDLKKHDVIWTVHHIISEYTQDTSRKGLSLVFLHALSSLTWRACGNRKCNTMYYIYICFHVSHIRLVTALSTLKVPSTQLQRWLLHAPLIIRGNYFDKPSGSFGGYQGVRQDAATGNNR